MPIRKKPATKRKPAPKEPPKPRGKRPFGIARRWNLKQAAREFGVHRELLDRARVAQHILPGEDGNFSTAQVVAMAFGDKYKADAARATAEAEAAQRKNLREAGELIPTAVAIALVEPICVIIRQKIAASTMTDAEKDDLLSDLQRAGELHWAKAAREAMR